MIKLHLFLDIIQLIFPKTCFNCKFVLIKNERILCMKCYLNLPKHIGFRKKHQINLYVRGQSYKVYARYKYQKKSIIQRMILELKYQSNRDLGFYLGTELYKSISHLENVSFIIPVTLNKVRKKIRGYNQCEIIAKGLVKHLKCKILTNCLKRIENNESQTLKNRYERFENIQGIFKLKKNNCLENKHIILLDDVYTSGATVSECIKVLKQIKNIKISIVCLAL